ncbi:TPA: hypothetical protein ACYSC8_000929 [Citrobacter freundii]|uniref:Ead/Ea22-like family protein n=1 Tax=Citrobacter freundii TaxID=546 RepID=A0AAI9MM92_CITFR|nr:MULTISPECIES: hypothetical protein [Citrobacter]EKV7199235.1 hypothetical protein [Citrobacter freundii]EKX8774785.1 hypothetical protein [Citrobacter freundii]ELF4152775.1 hypothetical protein [Citrobacter freundii]ELJ5788398.1 hypothetical protein [Citrobacter freundii]ELQ7918721.1 hypothetical protein [Citrobacter freundii]
MTDEQMDDLMTLAVNMQREAETDCNRPSAMFAYAVQVAVLEIRETRSKYEELQSQNADLAVQLANAESKCRQLAAVVAENVALKNPDNWLSQSDYGYEASEVATQNGATDDESLRAGMIAIINRIETPATETILAGVRSEVIDWLDTEISAIDPVYRGDPSYEHDAYWMKNEVRDLVESAKKVFSCQQSQREAAQ